MVSIFYPGDAVSRIFCVPISYLCLFYNVYNKIITSERRWQSTNEKENNNTTTQLDSIKRLYIILWLSWKDLGIVLTVWYFVVLHLICSIHDHRSYIDCEIYQAWHLSTCIKKRKKTKIILIWLQMDYRDKRICINWECFNTKYPFACLNITHYLKYPYSISFWKDAQTSVFEHPQNILIQWTVYPFGAHVFIPVFGEIRVARFSFFCAMFCTSLFVLLVVVFSVLRFAASDDPFGIFKLVRFFYVLFYFPLGDESINKYICCKYFKMIFHEIS